MVLHGFWRSSAAYRARIALNLKKIDYVQKNYALAKGEHKSEEFLAKNPQGLVPALEVGDKMITQSLCILEYLDHLSADNPLLPDNIDDQIRVKSIAYAIACEIHPLNNLRVTNYLRDPLNHSDDEVTMWYHHWVKQEFTALEKKLEREPETGDFCHGDKPGFADCFLVPQVYNANRFKCDVSPYANILRINENCLALEAFQKAIPENQPDAVI
ncbi:maleylacetoacetate isomerase [Pseudemcibacter aquimaris]|uniref:maleylacetoacetate isomerase n=1 Tax=Pseudemcibacter aquimaris TaxID=2857064 RepID=UPI003B8307B9